MAELCNDEQRDSSNSYHNEEIVEEEYHDDHHEVKAHETAELSGEFDIEDDHHQPELVPPPLCSVQEAEQEHFRMKRRPEWSSAFAVSSHDSMTDSFRNRTKDVAFDMDALAIVQQEFNDKKVAFDEALQVHLYPLVLGDNPGVSNGVPLRIADQRSSLTTTDLRQTAPPEKIGKFPRSQRYSIALHAGSSRSALLKETKAVMAIQESRKQSQEDTAADIKAAFSQPEETHLKKHHQRHHGLLGGLFHHHD